MKIRAFRGGVLVLAFPSCIPPTTPSRTPDTQRDPQQPIGRLHPTMYAYNKPIKAME